MNNFIRWKLVSAMNSGHQHAMIQEYECIQKLNTIIIKVFSPTDAQLASCVKHHHQAAYHLSLAKVTIVTII